MASRTRHHSSATPLALAYAVLVVYASLYPFTGWRWPPGQMLLDLAVLPWPPWRDSFDLWSNGLGYLPLGFLATVAAARSGLGAVATIVLGVLAPSVLSYGCEMLQQFVPTRHPSLKDWSMNSAGAGAGWMLALALRGLGLAGRWHGLRERWFVRDSAGALALLTLWPVGLLAPLPVPLGMGQVDELIRTQVAEWLKDVPWAAALHALIVPLPAPERPLSTLAEAAITTLGLLAPCLIAFAVVAPGRRRVVMAVGMLVLALATMTLSTLLNFGPEHALSWIGRSTAAALLAGVGVTLLLAPWSRAVIVGCGLIALTGLVVAVSQAPADPYFAQSLQAWEQGRFVRFHGVAHWVGRLWPYVALAWLLSQLARGPQRG